MDQLWSSIRAPPSYSLNMQSHEGLAPALYISGSLPEVEVRVPFRALLHLFRFSSPHCIFYSSSPTVCIVPHVSLYFFSNRSTACSDTPKSCSPTTRRRS